MAWLVSDFEDVDFCDGTGWNVVAGIHRAIKERAECTAHPLFTIGDYGEDFEGDIWTCDEPDTGGRLYLIEQLRKFYTDITMLVEGYPGLVQWTVESAGDEIWTMEDLETDIGLGTWEEQLRDTTNPAPFIWLQACLDRLIYVRRLRGDLVLSNPYDDETVRYEKTTHPFEYTSAATAWSTMLSDTESVSSFPSVTLSASVSGDEQVGPDDYSSSAPHRFTNGYLWAPSVFIGTWTRAEWEITRTAAVGISISSVDVSIDGGDPVTVPLSVVTVDQDPTFTPADAVSIPLNGDRDDVTFDLDLPSSLPFNGTSGTLTGIGSFNVTLRRAWVYFDIAAELTDQEP